MATDQAGRMLKIYKKKLVNSKETVNLDTLEYEVSDLLRTIRERKDRTVFSQQREGQIADRREPAINGAESDIDQLVVLLEGARMSDAPMMPTANNDVMVSSG